MHWLTLSIGGLAKEMSKQLTSKYRLWIVLLLGFSSGLPLSLSGETLKAWSTAEGVSLTGIGFLSLVGIPYTFKFLLAPFVDRFWPQKGDKRKSWILFCQAMLCLTLVWMSFTPPSQNLFLLSILAVGLASFSACQDIVVDAYKIEILEPKEMAMGAALNVNGYRIALLVSGGVCLIIAGAFNWQTSYLAMALLMLLLMVVTWNAPDTPVVGNAPKTLKSCVVEPFFEFFSRKQSVLILLLIVLYKLGDAFAGNLTISFLLREIGFDLKELGYVIKTVGLIATLLGTTCGALLMNRLGWFHSLLLFGVLQAVANLAYCALLWTGANLNVASMAIFADNFFGGMGTAVFVGWLMKLCDKRFTASQYALLASLSAVGRVFIGPLAGFVAQTYGWQNYFIASVWFSVPGLILLLLLRYCNLSRQSHWALASADRG